jgi:hypothetical protein
MLALAVITRESAREIEIPGDSILVRLAYNGRAALGL